MSGRHADLYKRYMAAYSAYRKHKAACPACTAGQTCSAGAPLYERFVRLQDAYTARLREQRP
ncbi:hypothetical protein [Streptomyces sp. NPDC093094]|uniref:hypothetical protein n=1 Tax=Streptomyces sp. NPDC093094 TaxID=3366026 RepID=UPI0037FC8B82